MTPPNQKPHRTTFARRREKANEILAKKAKKRQYNAKQRAPKSPSEKLASTLRPPITPVRSLPPRSEFPSSLRANSDSTLLQQSLYESFTNPSPGIPLAAASPGGMSFGGSSRSSISASVMVATAQQSGISKKDSANVLGGIFKAMLDKNNDSTADTIAKNNEATAITIAKNNEATAITIAKNNEATAKNRENNAATFTEFSVFVQGMDKDQAEVNAKVLDSAIKDYEGRGGPPSIIDVPDARNLFDAPLPVGIPRAHHDHPTPVRSKLDFSSPATYSPFGSSHAASFGGSPATSFPAVPANSPGGGALPFAFPAAPAEHRGLPPLPPVNEAEGL
jgi:hypothetical protein